MNNRDDLVKFAQSVVLIEKVLAADVEEIEDRVSPDIKKSVDIILNDGYTLYDWIIEHHCMDVSKIKMLSCCANYNIKVV